MDLNPAFIRRIREQLGDEAQSLLRSLDSGPPVSVRLHPQKGGGLFPDTDAVPWCGMGRYLDERPSFTLDPCFHAGAYYVQEASSMLLAHVVEQLRLRTPAPAQAPAVAFETVLDACAAPGGKTTLLASALPGSFIVANEVIRSRVPPLTENVIKWGTGNIAVTSLDAARFGSMPGFFDLIAADVPCSGEGLFRKQPDARGEWSPENARHCSLRQRKILSDLWPALAPGGYLIYSTCTFNPEENERNLAWFTGQTGAQPVEIAMPAGVAVSVVAFGDVTGYCCFPDRVKGEGFFIAVIQKTGRDHSRGYPDNGRGRQKKAPFDVVPRADSDQLSGWFLTESGTPGSDFGSDGSPHSTDPHFIRYGRMIHRINRRHLAGLAMLHEAVPVRYAGIEIAELIRGEAKPAHAAALYSGLRHEQFDVADLNRDEALTFLRAEALAPALTAGKSWMLARYNGLGLGWLKQAGNRLNNHYPRAWRIRMQG